MINRENYHLVKEYLGSPENVSACVDSIERYSSNLRHLLIWADETYLGQAEILSPSLMEYVKTLRSHDHPDKIVSGETKKKIIGQSKCLFEWAKMKYPEKFGGVSYEWIKGLVPEKIHRDQTIHDYVTEEMALCIAELVIDEDNIVLKRDQAAHALGYLSGMRGGAFVTLPVKAVRLDDMEIYQWPELGVETKNGVKATTFLLQIPKLLEIVRSWDRFVREQFGPDTLWYPNLEQRWGGNKKSENKPGENRLQNWNDRLEVLYKRAGISYLSSHKLRHGHAIYGLEHARSMSDYKAVSINLMHADITITDSVYAFLSMRDTKKRILALSANPAQFPDDELRAFLYKLSPGDLPRVLNIMAERMSQ